MGLLTDINNFFYNAITGKLSQQQLDQIGNNAIADVTQAGGNAQEQAAAAAEAEAVAGQTPNVSNPLGNALNPFEGGFNLEAVIVLGLLGVGAYFVFSRRVSA